MTMSKRSAASWLLSKVVLNPRYLFLDPIHEKDDAHIEPGEIVNPKLGIISNSGIPAIPSSGIPAIPNSGMPVVSKYGFFICKSFSRTQHSIAIPAPGEDETVTRFCCYLQYLTMR